MFRNIFQFFVLIVIIAICQSELTLKNGYYTIVGSRLLRSNSDYHVAVTGHGIVEPIEIRVGVKSEDGDPYDYNKMLKILPDTSELVTIEIGEVAGRNILYAVSTDPAIGLSNATFLRYNDKEFDVHIQTDRSLYKPGDTVQFRVIFLDGGLKAAAPLGDYNIYVFDSRQNRVKYWAKPPIVHGVFKTELPLPPTSHLGEWTIVMDYKDSRYTKSFEIDRYVIPRFQILVKPQLITTYDEEKIPVTIEAKYVDGRPVKGQATIIARPTQSVGTYKASDYESTSSKTILIDGQTVVDFSIRDDLRMKETWERSHGRDVFFEVTLEEQFTGVRLSSSGKSSIRLNKTQIEMKLPGTDRINTDSQIVFNILTKTPKINNEISIEIIVKEDGVKNVTYQVIGRADLLETKLLEVQNQMATATFIATTKMAPKMRFIVFYITGRGEIVSNWAELTIPTDFSNFIELELSKNQVFPGEHIEVLIKTNPNSYVGIMAVDQSSILLRDENNLDESSILTSMITRYEDKLHEHHRRKRQITSSWWDSHMIDFADVGLVVLSNSYPREFSDLWDPIIVPFGAPLRLRRSIADTNPSRNSFPETWIFDDIESSGPDGQIKLSEVIPDTTTSWIMTAFSIDPIHGFSMTRIPLKLEVSKPLQISATIPHSIKRGETLTIPVVIFNYLDESVEVEASLDNNQSDFDLIEDSVTKKFDVQSKNSVSLSYQIRPKRVGYVILKLTAKSLKGSDTIEQQLLVEPEGVTKYIRQRFFIDLLDSSEYSQAMTVDIPDNVVPDSTRIDLSVSFDIFGQPKPNLKKEIVWPHGGDGEQIAIQFIRDIMIYDYLVLTNQIDSETTRFAKSCFELGYEREFAHLHEDGSFTASSEFYNDPGSSWLTAFVAKYYRRAKNFTDINEKHINNALNFLKSRQAENGSFTELGTILDQEILGGVKNDMALTAYVLISFIQSADNRETYDTIIKKGVEYLANNLGRAEDTFSLMMIAYVLQLVDHKMKTEVWNIVAARAIKKDGKMWWMEEPHKEKNSDTGSGHKVDISEEMTAYGLLILLEANRMEDAVSVMKWLESRRGSNGLFSSTQGTMVGFEAMIKFIRRLHGKENDVQVSLKYDGKLAASIQVNPENEKYLQSFEVPADIRTFQVIGTGRGAVIGEVLYRYNLINDTEPPRFKISIDSLKDSTNDLMRLKVCTSFMPDADKNELVSGLAVVEVKLPSGYVVDTVLLDDIRKSNPKAKRIETRKMESVLNFYYDSLNEEGVCSTLVAFRRYVVENLRPAVVSVYNYNDDSLRAREYYFIPA